MLETGCPKKQCVLHSWRNSRSGWTGLWTTRSCRRCLCPWQEASTRWSMDVLFNPKRSMILITDRKEARKPLLGSLMWTHFQAFWAVPAFSLGEAMSLIYAVLCFAYESHSPCCFFFFHSLCAFIQSSLPVCFPIYCPEPSFFCSVFVPFSVS